MGKTYYKNYISKWCAIKIIITMILSQRTIFFLVIMCCSLLKMSQISYKIFIGSFYTKYRVFYDFGYFCYTIVFDPVYYKNHYNLGHSFLLYLIYRFFSKKLHFMVFSIKIMSLVADLCFLGKVLFLCIYIWCIGHNWK